MPDRATNEPPWTLRSLNARGDVRFRPCPFCSSNRLGLYEYVYSKLFAVDCRECGAQGPRHSSPDRAQALWNMRGSGTEDPPADESRGRGSAARRGRTPRH